MTRIPARRLASDVPPFGRSIEVVRPPDVPEGSVVTVLRVPPEAAGMRLDRFVQGELRRTSRTRAQQILARGAHTPAGVRLRRNARVRAEQCILLWRAPWDEGEDERELPVLYEDSELLAVDKPAGVPVHPTARYFRSTVVKRLERSRPGEWFTLAHRLDRETSGVLLLARTREADRGVKAQFERRDGVEKVYLALSWGWPVWDSLPCDAPLALDPRSRFRVKMRVVDAGGLPAQTLFQTLERRRHPGTGRRYALLGCRLRTGRQHQIRAHLAHLGHAVLGDKLYGPDEEIFGRAADGLLTAEDLVLLELDRHALHAAELALRHPLTGAALRITAPFPPDLANFWAGLVPG